MPPSRPRSRRTSIAGMDLDPDPSVERRHNGPGLMHIDPDSNRNWRHRKSVSSTGSTTPTATSSGGSSYIHSRGDVAMGDELSNMMASKLTTRLKRVNVTTRGNNLAVPSIFQPSAMVNAFASVFERNQIEQAQQFTRLQIARNKYIASLKKKILDKDGSGGPALEALPTQPRIHNSLETAADKKANTLFLFPDTDPAVYRRQIDTPLTFTHEPVFGF